MLTLYNTIKTKEKESGVNMYETYSYEQIKTLPDNLKIEALKELKSIYPDNRDLAEHLGAAHIAVSNMVSKYLEGKTVGRKKMTPEEKAQKKAERELKKQQELEKMQTQIQTQESKQEKETESNIPPIQQETEVINSSFSIKLEKDMLGEEATLILNGIAGTLLKEDKYKISLNVVGV